MPSSSHASDLEYETETEEVEEVEDLAVDTGSEEVQNAWAEAAREVLLKAARSYGSMITQQKLATQIQDRTDLHTDRQIRHWIGGVLRKVADECASRDEPLLIALCIDARGSVGEAYTSTVHDLRGEDIENVDDHAARERLACYERFGATLPSGGGLATLAPQVAAARTRARKKAAEERVIPICPNCFTAVPATGVCDNCG